MADMCGTTTKQGCLFSFSIAYCCKNKITFFWLFNCNHFSHPFRRTITSEGHFRDFFCTLAAKLIINIYWSEIKIKTYQKLPLAIHGIIIAAFSQGAESQQILPEVHIKSNVNANIHVQLVAQKKKKKRKLQMFTACPYANRQIITHTHPYWKQIIFFSCYLVKDMDDHIASPNIQMCWTRKHLWHSPFTHSLTTRQSQR